MVLIEEMITQIMDFHAVEMSAQQQKVLNKIKRSAVGVVPPVTSATIINKFSLLTATTSTPSTANTPKFSNKKTSINNERYLPKLTHLHIGCDEVYRMAECPRCRSKTK